MRYLSVCSGVEAASLAWKPLGWEPVGFSEIADFPSRILAERFPGTPNLGDMNQHEQWKTGDFDVLAGGTPCQSFSVAGLRGGLADPRGGLMLRFLEIARDRRPRWVVWENVAGVLSSNGGRDFGTLLGGLAGLGYGAAYRLLDASWFGVPQRRRRVILVAHHSDVRPAGKVLFERESLRGLPQKGQKGKDTGEAQGSHVCPFCSREAAPGDPDPRIHGCAGCGGWCKCPVNTLADGAHMGGGANGQDILSGRIVVDRTGRPRKLTIVECERLMGMPDDWTRLSAKPDLLGPRFRAVGNSIAVPVLSWIGARMEACG